MGSKKQKIIVIVGPTASGKSELAVRIARACRGEIISADSRQIYRGLDIGSGKVEGRWRMAHSVWPKAKNGKKRSERVYVYKGIAHHLIDAVSLRRTFTAAEFKKRAEKAMTEIRKRTHVSVVTGGTGFYIDAILYDLSFPDVRPDTALRRRLGKKTTTKLFLMLKKKDPRRARTIDRQNPQRLIRALEIAGKLGTVRPLKKRTAYDTLILGIDVPRPELLNKIDRRLEKRFREGMIGEVSGLLHSGVSYRRLDALGLEYRFISLFLRKKISKKIMTAELKLAIHHYAKRQLTWFRRNKDIVWIRPDEIKKALRLAKVFLR